GERLARTCVPTSCSAVAVGPLIARLTTPRAVNAPDRSRPPRLGGWRVGLCIMPVPVRRLRQIQPGPPAVRSVVKRAPDLVGHDRLLARQGFLRDLWLP